MRAVAKCHGNLSSTFRGLNSINPPRCVCVCVSEVLGAWHSASFTHYSSPTSSRETSTMKHGGGQQRVRLVVNSLSFGSCCTFLAGNAALPLPGGRVVVGVVVWCSISWSRQTPSTRPDEVRDDEGGGGDDVDGICKTMAGSISDCAAASAAAAVASGVVASIFGASAL